MAIDCPNCRRDIPWLRVLLTPAWGRWRCAGCGALLGVNVRRRLLLVGIWLVLLFIMLEVVGITRFYGYVAGLGMLLLLLIVHFSYFERVALVERTGFRCQRCGYDLAGQVESRCPECGTQFDADELAQSRQPQAASGRRRPTSRLGWTVFLVIAVALTTLLSIGLWLSTTGRGRARTPPAGPQSPPASRSAGSADQPPPTSPKAD